MIDWAATPNNASELTKRPDTIQVNIESQTVLLEQISECLRVGRGFTVATVNLDHIVKMYQSDRFYQAYKHQTYVVADGNPIVWLSRLAGRKIELVPGSELILPVISLATNMGVPVALLGATQETLDETTMQLKKDYPKLNIVACIAPVFGFDPEGAEAQECVDELSKSGAKMCLLALGAPKQEIFAVYAARYLPHCGFISIGAGLDFIAGSQTRAPLIVRKLAMEWLWRMLSNPRRLVYRYRACIAVLPKLIVQAFRARKL
jgi:N-acetylglucosaminyldiphosphoundecaprenol N-acetyl-beta-D-mannosaminyltransferase